MKREHFEILERQFTALTEIEKLAVAKVRKWNAYPSSMYPASPPTAASVARIERDLALRIPESYISLAKIAPNYGVWFGSIGEDYTSRNHILWCNSVFRIADEEHAALPANFVIFNHGHDGDCDCWKVDELIAGEHPIYFISVESSAAPQLLAASFLEYWKRHV